MCSSKVANNVANEDGLWDFTPRRPTTKIRIGVKVSNRWILAREAAPLCRRRVGAEVCRHRSRFIKIHENGVQWKQGVVVYIILQAVLLYDTTPTHCTPLRLHPPLMNTQRRFSAMLNRSACLLVRSLLLLLVVVVVVVVVVLLLSSLSSLLSLAS